MRTSWRQTHGERPRECEISLYRHGCDPPEAAPAPLACQSASRRHDGLLRRRCRGPEHPVTSSVPARVPRHHLLIRVWLIGWLTTIALFHVHLPDITDAWSTLHSGGAHTVLTPDLPGEFASPIYNGQAHSSHVSQRAVNSPEFGLMLFEESDKARKVIRFLSLGAPSCSLDTARLRRVLDACLETDLQRHHFLAVPAARAPPSTGDLPRLRRVLDACLETDQQRHHFLAVPAARAPPSPGASRSWLPKFVTCLR